MVSSITKYDLDNLDTVDDRLDRNPSTTWRSDKYCNRLTDCDSRTVIKIIPTLLMALFPNLITVPVRRNGMEAYLRPMERFMECHPGCLLYWRWVHLLHWSIFQTTLYFQHTWIIFRFFIPAVKVYKNVILTITCLLYEKTIQIRNP